MIFVFNFSCIPLLLSCSGQTNKNTPNYELTPLKELTFKSGFASWNIKCISYEESECIAIADFVTHKKIVIHNLESQKIIHEIPLKKIIEKGDKIRSFEFLDDEAVLISTLYTNRLYSCSFDGSIIRQIELNDYCPTEEILEFTAGTDKFIYKNSLIWCSDLVYDQQNLKNGFYSSPEDFEIQHKKRPFLVKINNYLSDSLFLSFGMENFYSRFVDSNLVCIEGKGIRILDERLFLYSNFTDTIYEVCPKTLQLKYCYGISSKYTRIGYTPPTQYDIEKNNAHIEFAKTKGYIYNLLFYPKNGVFLVVLRHNSNPVAGSDQKSRPWSILICDHEFSILDEIKMDESRYAPQVITSKMGILISNYPNTKTDSNAYQQTTYTLFDLVAN